MLSKITYFYLFINLLCSAFTDLLHDHHGVINYELINCNEQKIHKIGENSYEIYFSAFNISYNICLNSIPNYVSNQVSKMLSDNIKHLSGSICDFPEFKVNGFIDNNCFYGSIINNNSHLSIEIPANMKNNYKNKVLAYRNVDVNKPLQLIDKPIHFTKPRPNITLNLEGVDMENKYCGITIDMHTSFISLYTSKSAAISSVINAVHFLNTVISAANIEETPPIIFYIKEINNITRLPISSDTQNVQMYELLDKYNQLLNQANRKSCMSSLFIGIKAADAVGVAYVGDHYGTSICDKATSGSVLTKVSNFSISDLDFWQLFAHEIGHQLGSEHDPVIPCTGVSKACPTGISDTECIGDSERGRFIMFEYAQLTKKANSNLFSKCSIRYIKNLINIPVRRKCLEYAPTSYDNTTVSQKCGNGIIDLLEECDAGQNDDKCCTSQCTLTPGSECSDFNGKCCNDCKLLAKGSLCSKSTQCSFKSVCDGISPKCLPKYKNDIQCDKKQGICSDGVCIHDICDYYDLQKCEILQEDLLCKVSCSENNADCEPIISEDGLNYYKPKKTPCNNGNGICSDDGKCLYTARRKLSDVMLDTSYSDDR